MTHAPARLTRSAAVLLGAALLTGPKCALAEVDLQTAVGFSQNLNAPLPLDAEFRDENGTTVQLGDYFGARPVIVTPVYYRCPMLCGLELQGLLRSLRALSLTAGVDFQIVTYSIDPREAVPLARGKRERYLAEYNRQAAAAGWHFLTGDEKSIQRLNDAIGFRAAYNEETGQFAHAAGIVVCTPEGRVARYLYGVEFPPQDLRLSLVEASENRIGTLADQVLLYCYLYDPTRGRYGVAILRLIRFSGVLTVLLLAGGITWMLRRERRRAESSIA